MPNRRGWVGRGSRVVGRGLWVGCLGSWVFGRGSWVPNPNLALTLTLFYQRLEILETQDLRPTTSLDRALRELIYILFFIFKQTGPTTHDPRLTYPQTTTHPPTRFSLNHQNEPLFSAKLKRGLSRFNTRLAMSVLGCFLPSFSFLAIRGRLCVGRGNII